MDKNIDYFVIFGGGAIRGIAYVGVLRAFEELNIFPSKFAGSSIGSIFSTLFCIGYSVSELKEIALSTKFELFKDINFNFLPDFSLSKGEVFLNWLREIVEAKFPQFSDKMITFSDIEKDLFIIATDLKNNEPVIFSKYTTPDFEVAKAIRISCSMPGLMKPLEYEGKLLVDGDLTKPMPAFEFLKRYKQKNQRFLEFRLEGDKKNSEIKNSIEFIDSIITCISNIAMNNILNNYPENYDYDFIPINTRECLLVNLNAKEAERYELMDIGYCSVIEYFKTLFPSKARLYLVLNRKLYSSLLKIQSNILLNKINEAKACIGELFVGLFKIKGNIPEELAVKFSDFESLFSSNYKKSLFLKSGKLSNKFEILQKIEEILKNLEKIREKLEVFEKK